MAQTQEVVMPKRYSHKNLVRKAPACVVEAIAVGRKFRQELGASNQRSSAGRDGVIVDIVCFWSLRSRAKSHN